MAATGYGPQYCPECNDEKPQAVTGEWDWGVQDEQTLIQLACGHKFVFLKDHRPT